MQFLLMMWNDESRAPDPARADPTPWIAFNREVREAGVLLSAGGLQPTEAATTVRRPAEERLVTDGPFLEAKEQVGGFYLLDCQDLDEALSWAAKVPNLAFGGAVEVRPLAQVQLPEDARSPNQELAA